MAHAGHSGILVVGVVRGLGGLRQFGRVEGAAWGEVSRRAASLRVDLVVVGQPSPGVDAAADIARLKDDPATAAIPILHQSPADTWCCGCRADVCLSAEATHGQFARVAEALLELARARARRSGLYAARFCLAAGAASRPAP